MPARHVTVRVEAGTVRLHLPRATFDLSHNEGRALRDVLNRTLPEQITDLMHDPRIKDVDVLQAAQTMLAERGQDTESLSVAIAAIENPRCTLCGCGATGEAFGFPVCDYHVDHTEDDPQCPHCMTADEEQPRDGRELLRELRDPAPVLADANGARYCHSCVQEVKLGLHDEHPDASDEWWCAQCGCGLTAAAWERERAGKFVRPGDRVRDPHGGAWRTVARVENTTVHMTDGGCMGIDECRDVRLPSEALD